MYVFEHESVIFGPKSLVIKSEIYESALIVDAQRYVCESLVKI